ncbi:VanZ family protein [Micromonospora sp. DT31]|uniref:VanZ family protein n=1 Tax=Micromonospora sp. DT31 TaxID=3393434 RepID=UPI003CFADCA8
MVAGWHGWFGTFTGIALLAAVVLPLAALVVWALARRRVAAGVTPAWAWRMSLAEVGMVYGTVPWVWMTMLPDGPAGAVAADRIILVPGQDLLAISAAGPLRLAGQVVVNLLVFAALGFFAPQRFAVLASVPRILALGAGCSLLVEMAQHILLERVSSVDDVLLNAAGAGLAALTSRRWWRARAAVSADQSRSVTAPGR